MTPLLVVRDLSVVYPRRGAESLVAARGISFEVKPGEVLALVGETGSGKSTVLKSLGGLLPPDARVLGGEVTFDPGDGTGIDLLATRSSRRRKLRATRIACFFSPGIEPWNPGRTLGQHLRETVQLAGRSRELRSEKDWMPALYDVGLIEPEQLLGRLPREVSPLVLVRVRLAMALLSGADLWLSDDFTGDLDANGEDQVLRLMRELAGKHGIAMVVAISDIGVVERLADRVVIIYEGGIVETGRVTDLLGHPKNLYTRAMLDCLPRLGERRDRLGEADASARQDAIDASRGVEG